MAVVEFKSWLSTNPTPGVQTAKNAYLLDVGQFVRGQARANVRQKTRKLRDSIKRSGLEPSATGKTVTVRVYSTMPERWRWENEGTGIYGPRQAIIKPKHAKVLAWPAGPGVPFVVLSKRPKMRRFKAGARQVTMIFRKWTRGMKGSKAMHKAINGAATKAYRNTRRIQLDREIKRALDRAVKA